MRLGLVFLLKIALLLVTPFVGGHGILNFLVLILSFIGFEIGEMSLFLVFSIGIYFSSIFILTVSLFLNRKLNNLFYKFSLTLDLVSFLSFTIFAFLTNVSPILFPTTSIPFLIISYKLLKIFYLERKFNS